jgi:hypothetical protein
MSRLLHGDEGELFRAVITTYEKTYGSDEVKEYIEYAGPFGGGAPAAAAITRATRHAADRLRRSQWLAGKYSTPLESMPEDILVEGKVQRTDVRWEAP